MSGRPIRALEAGIVPHRCWPHRQWFYSASGRYYHRPYHRATPRPRYAPGPGFYSRLDPQLRELCRLLHRHGLATTPSCQGHFHDREYFERRWEGLTGEARRIRGTGLPVWRAEDEEEYRFQAADYQLPWQRFEEFFRESSAHQRAGYLGVLVPVGRLRLLPGVRALDAHAGVETAVEAAIGERRGVHLCHLLLRPSDPAAGARMWQRVTDRFAELLGE